MRNLINLIESVSNLDDAEPDWHEAIANQDWKDALSNSSTPAQVREVLRLSGATEHKVGTNPKLQPVWKIGEDILEWDGEETHPTCENIWNWLYDANLDKYFPDHEEIFNSEFWQYPKPLYHQTTSANAQSIEHEGIRIANLTRGINNRGVGSSIFTTMDYDLTLEGHYGDVVFEINTKQMKTDGFTPYVSLEPEIVEHEYRTALAHQLGTEFDSDPESGIREETVIIYDNVPAKYLRRMED
jgi:hypothetical protein